MVGADAIHPGYGFLAENAQFAEMCRDSNIEFIGPSAESIRLLGDKAAARKMAKKAKVPTVPGSDGVIESDEEAIKIGKKVGYPLMVKALAGGGGRGLRIVRSADDLRRPCRCRAPRRSSRSITAACTSRSTSSARATSRCRSSATRRATWCTCSSATAPFSAATRN